MNRAVRVTALLDEKLVQRVDAFAADRYKDRASALRQLVDFALRELEKRQALAAYGIGQVTLAEFARALGVDVETAADLLRAEGVDVSQRGEIRVTLDDLAAGVKA